MSVSLPDNNILIIDKHTKDVEPLKVILGIYGYTVTVCNDSILALHKALRKSPDLVLIEASMSTVDEFELIKFLRHYEDTEEVPIIYLSDQDNSETKMQAFALGADDYIAKPYQIDEVVARISIHLNKIEKQKALKNKITELEAYTNSVANDIKSPLGVMNGFADQLRTYWDDYDDGSKRTFLDVIDRNSRKISEIVEELLTFTDVSRADILIEPLNMTEVIENVMARLAQSEEKYLGKMIVPDQWPIVVGYGPWVEEVWINYIANAIKCCGQDADIELGFSNAGSEFTKFWVKDSGPGLSKQEAEAVFQKYTRPNQNDKNGSGLGLSIAKRIVEKLGGEVGVTSKLGEGSTFEFSLPLQKI